MVRVNLRVRAGLDDLKPDAKIAEMSRSGETTGDLRCHAISTHRAGSRPTHMVARAG